MKKKLKDWQIALMAFAFVVFVGCFLAAGPRPVPYAQRALNETEVEELQEVADSLKDIFAEKENDIKRLTVEYAYDETTFGFEKHYVVVRVENGSLLRIKVKAPIYSEGDSILVEEIKSSSGIIKYKEVAEYTIRDTVYVLD